MEALIRHLVCSLASHPEQVEVTRVTQAGGDRLDVRVAPSDFARIVGRQGRTARALRTVLSAAHHQGPAPFLNLVDPEEG